jgi:hypothetical protein
MVLLILTGVLLRSLYARTQIELGFDPSRMLTLRVDIPASRYAEDARILGFFEDLLKRTRALPGVQSACLTSHRPILGNEPERMFTILGRPEAKPNETPRAAVSRSA